MKFLADILFKHLFDHIHIANDHKHIDSSSFVCLLNELRKAFQFSLPAILLYTEGPCAAQLMKLQLIVSLLPV